MPSFHWKGSHSPMVRLLCVEYPGEGYHVMNRWLVRQAIFRDLTDYGTFLQVSVRLMRCGVLRLSLIL